MVNPRYRPTIANSRTSVGQKKEVILSETKKDFVYPAKEKYIGSHIKSVTPTLGLKKKMEYLKNLKKKRFNKKK